MTRKIDSFRIGEVFCLIMPQQTGVASAMNEYKLHLNTCNNLPPAIIPLVKLAP
jgi:hypothetical protein